MKLLTRIFHGHFGIECRSADLRSAVSHVCNLRTLASATTSCLLQAGDTAGLRPALYGLRRGLGEITAQPPGCALQFIDVDAVQYPQRFYRFVPHEFSQLMLKTNELT